jgi:two-component system response regulator QseB
MPTGTVRLLLVEDDEQLAKMLAELLDQEGYQVDVAGNGQDALCQALNDSYELMVVDRGLPAIEGLDLIARLRGHGVGTPVLVLSALGTAADRIEGLDAGAEDYLTKPFDLGELLARLRALRRRNAPGSRSLPLGHGGRRLEPDSRTVSGTPPVQLSERECALLMMLAANPGRVFTRDDLRETVFRDAGSDTAVETYVHYLRRKLGRRIVTTVRGRGYRLGE